MVSFFHFGKWIVFLRMRIATGHSLVLRPSRPVHLSLDICLHVAVSAWDPHSATSLPALFSLFCVAWHES